MILNSVLAGDAGPHGDSARPVVKWAGGKRSLRRQLFGLAPPRFNRFHEPFLGGATFFLFLAPEGAVLNDANCDLMQLYEAIRDEPEAVMAELDTFQPHVLDEQFYYRTRAVAPASLPPARRAARFIYLNKTCYNELYRVNSAGLFNVPFGRYTAPPTLYQPTNILRVARLLRRARLSCSDFAPALADAGKDDFVYLDPPYVPLTATASFTRYTRDAFTAHDQRRLATAVHELTARGCLVLLSNSDTPLVRELYDGYHIDEVFAPRSINSDAGRRHKISELAIRNYPLPPW